MRSGAVDATASNGSSQRCQDQRSNIRDQFHRVRGGFRSAHPGCWLLPGRSLLSRGSCTSWGSAWSAPGAKRTLNSISLAFVCWSYPKLAHDGLERELSFFKQKTACARCVHREVKENLAITNVSCIRRGVGCVFAPLPVRSNPETLQSRCTSRRRIQPPRLAVYAPDCLPLKACRWQNQYLARAVPLAGGRGWQSPPGFTVSGNCPVADMMKKRRIAATGQWAEKSRSI